MFFSAIIQLLSKIFLFTGKIERKNSFEKPLSPKEEHEMFVRLARGDSEAEEKLIKHNLRLVAHIANKYKGDYDSDDLISIGSIGLLKAVKKYDYTKGNNFSTFASRCIENEILMMFRSEKKHLQAVSFEDKIGSDKDGNEVSLLDVLQSNENVELTAEKALLKKTIQNLISNSLDEREQKIINMRFGLNGYFPHTQREVAKKLNITRSYVSRLEKKALDILKQKID